MFSDVSSIGKMLMLLGVILFLTGLAMHLGLKFNILGRLPGDISFQKENFSFYFPITTSILLSILLTILLNIFFKR